MKIEIKNLIMSRAPISAVVVLGAMIAGCGGPSSPTPVPGQSVLSIRSQPGDWIGGGRDYRFTSEMAKFTEFLHAPNSDTIEIRMLSNDFHSYWTVFMGPPIGQSLHVGTYDDAVRWIPGSVSRPRLTVHGDGRGCGTSEGRFTIQQLTYGDAVRISTGDTVPKIELLHVVFSYRCSETSAPGLTGELTYVASP